MQLHPACHFEQSIDCAKESALGDTGSRIAINLLTIK
jgi:hypothetical protein